MGRKSLSPGRGWIPDATTGGLARPLVVGHRGAREHAPDNTVAAVESAFDEGADAVEVDVRLAVDGVAVAFHDPVVEMAGGEALTVAEATLAQLQDVDLGGGSEASVRVPTLDDVAAAALGRGGLMLELKNLPGQPGFDAVREGAADAAAATLRDFDGPGLIASFNPRSIERCLARSPEIQTGFLSTSAMDPASALRYVSAVGHTWVIPQTPALLSAGQAFVGAAHRAGVLVATWVANEPSELATLFSWGVDAVATDRPALAVSVRTEVLGG